MTSSFCFLTVFLSALSGCEARRSEPSTTKEAYDRRNAPSQLGARLLRYEEITRRAATGGALPVRPWEDDYWAFIDKNMAFRWVTQRRFPTFEAQVSDATSEDAVLDNLSPAEKYDLLVGDPEFSVTRESWSIYDYYRRRHGETGGSWSWMGICSGWAPASISERAPGNAVLARNDEGREILFLEGDLRGLLSKAYDMNSRTKTNEMLGSRCDTDPGHLLRDADGRLFDGLISGRNQRIRIERDAWASRGILAVSRVGGSRAKLTWMLAADMERTRRLAGTYQVFLYSTQEDLRRDLKNETPGEHASEPAPVKVQLYKACRDVNPGAFHLALVENLSDAAKKKRGLIIELDSTRQVWNQPIWGFKSRFGHLRPVSASPAEKRMLMAPETTHTVDVTTQVAYIVEPLSVPIDYPDPKQYRIDLETMAEHRDGYSMREFRYTLEFDRNGHVIGGEWAPNHERGTPDFLWRPRGRPTDFLRTDPEQPSVLKYSVVAKLIDCSYREPDTQATVSSVLGTYAVPAVKCRIRE